MRIGRYTRSNPTREASRNANGVQEDNGTAGANKPNKGEGNFVTAKQKVAASNDASRSTNDVATASAGDIASVRGEANQARVISAWERIERAVGSKDRALRIGALGLWLAWFWAAFGFGACNPSLEGPTGTWSIAGALIAASVLFALWARNPAASGQASKAVTIGVAAAAAICCAPLPLADAVALPMPVAIAASCVCGAGAAWLLMLCAEGESTLSPTDNFIAFLASWLVASLAYAIATNLAGLGQAIVLAALPLACGACLAAAGHPGAPAYAATSSLAPEEAHAMRTELLIGVAVFFFTIGFVRSAGLSQATGPANFHIGASAAAALFALYALIGIGYALRGRMTLPFIRTCYAFASLGLAFATMTMALTETGGSSVRTLTDVAYLALLPAVWCAAGAGVSVHGRSTGQAFGGALAVIAASSTAGWLAQHAVAIVYAQQDATTTLLLGLGFLCFAYFMFGFPITSFSSYLMRPEDRSPELNAFETAGDHEGELHHGLTFREGVGKLADKAALSKREREVLLLLAKGLSNERIAEELVISYHTVRAHVRNIYGKLEVHNRQELLEQVEDARKENSKTGQRQ